MAVAKAGFRSRRREALMEVLLEKVLPTVAEQVDLGGQGSIYG